MPGQALTGVAQGLAGITSAQLQPRGRQKFRSLAMEHLHEALQRFPAAGGEKAVQSFGGRPLEWALGLHPRVVGICPEFPDLNNRALQEL